MAISVSKRIKDEYVNAKKNHLKSVVFINDGDFYRTFGEDAVIIWSLMDYKFIDGFVGFPKTSISKLLKN